MAVKRVVFLVVFALMAFVAIGNEVDRNSEQWPSLKSIGDFALNVAGPAAAAVGLGALAASALGGGNGKNGDGQATDGTGLPRSKWGVPTFEDEGCVMCQYVMERAEGKLLKTLEKIDAKVSPRAGRNYKGLVSSPSDPFGNPLPPSPPTADKISSVNEAAGGDKIPPPMNYNSDLHFSPNLQYKKKLLQSLKTRWMGKSIARKVWSKWIQKFCSQGELPEMYVPVCGMLYKNSAMLMNTLFYGFPADQACLMSKMCGPRSYFAAPTAVHNPVMSMYYNNMRGPLGFAGGEHGRRD